MLNGALDSILKAFDKKLGQPSFHEVNQWKDKDWTDWQEIFWLWIPFRKTGLNTQWLWYEGTETDRILVKGDPTYVTREVGGVYGESSINYILAGHAARQLGANLGATQLMAQLWNLSQHGHLAGDDVFWLTKGWQEYESRKSW